MKSLFLFDDKTSSVESDFFTVLPGHVAILMSHGVQGGTHAPLDPTDFKENYRISVERASVPPGSLDITGIRPTIEGLAILAKADPRYVSLVSTDCSWEMDCCSNLRAITVPGVYRLRLSTEEMMGTAVVEVIAVTIAQASEMPDSIKFGN